MNTQQPRSLLTSSEDAEAIKMKGCLVPHHQLTSNPATPMMAPVPTWSR